MNKILCTFLAFAMLFSLCACGGSASDVSGSKTVNAGTSASGTVTASEPATAEVPETEAEENFSVGATVNNTYENAYFGIGVTLDDNWLFETQEKINEDNGMVLDALDNADYMEAMENGTVYTDMSASANEGLINLIATIEKLNAIATLAVDEESYIDITLQNNDFKAIFEELGLEVSKVDKGTATIAGVEHPCVVIEGSIEGFGFYEKVAAVKKGNYMLSITVSSITEDVVDDVFAYFYAL